MDEASAGLSLGACVTFVLTWIQTNVSLEEGGM